jgi:DNA processing protein
MALRHWLQLALTEGIGPILTSRLISIAGGAEAACAAGPELLRSIEGIGPAKSRAVFESLKRAAREVDREIVQADSTGVSLICLDDPSYPEILKTIPDPPPLLYLKGEFQPRDLNSLAIVGSRRCSHYGREQAERFGALLAQAAFTVVSGGARGVDSAAHRGAMSPREGRTIVVLGCGVDIVYPPENSALFDDVSRRGAIVSEFPFGTPPIKENFPRRNRLISGLSRGVLVIEADIASGALITARQACDSHNRPVFAIPGRIDNAMSAGPHALIRDGAVLVTSLEDILDNLGPVPHQAMLFSEEPAMAETAAPVLSFDDRQKRILEMIDHDPTHLDVIIARTEFPAEVVMRELTMLALRGAVKRVEGQIYVRKR